MHAGEAVGKSGQQSLERYFRWQGEDTTHRPGSSDSDGSQPLTRRSDADRRREMKCRASVMRTSMYVMYMYAAAAPCSGQRVLGGGEIESRAEAGVLVCYVNRPT